MATHHTRGYRHDNAFLAGLCGLGDLVERETLPAQEAKAAGHETDFGELRGLMDWIEVLLKGGQTGMLGLAAVVLVWAVRTLTRYQDLLKDYPPHRHINGTRIVYPKEYQPSPIERMAEGGD